MSTRADVRFLITLRIPQLIDYGKKLLLIFMNKIHLMLSCLLLFALTSCDDSSDNRGCYECTVTFTTTGSDNDRTTESNVIKCNVTEEDIKEMERLAADTITAQDGVTVTTKAQCNKL